MPYKPCKARKLLHNDKTIKKGDTLDIFDLQLIFTAKKLTIQNIKVDIDFGSKFEGI